MNILQVLYIFFCVVSSAFGIVIGSFLNVVIYRLPVGKTISKGRSNCMSCGHTLAAKDLVPVFSWLFLNGKCRYCGAKIASRYAKIELLTGLIFLIAAISHREASYFFFEYKNISLLACFIIFVLFLVSISQLIPQMMIYYDENKAFIGLSIVSTIAALIANSIYIYFYNLNYLYLLFPLGLIGVFLIVSTSIRLISSKRFSITSFALDLSIASMLTYVNYIFLVSTDFLFFVFVFIYSLIYSIIGVAIRNKPSGKLIGIIGFIPIPILMIIRFVVYNILQ